MNKKLVVWLIGSHGSGKSTQCDKLVKAFFEGSDDEVLIKEGEKIVYTIYGDSGVCVLGKPNKKGICGLDSCYSKVGSEGIGLTLEAALQDKSSKVILIDCIMSSFIWYNHWLKRNIIPDFNLLVVHLDLTLYQNIVRILERREKAAIENWNKKGTAIEKIELNDEAVEHAISKNKETKVIFDKLMGSHSKSKFQLADEGIKIDALLPVDKIHLKILNQINKML